MMEGVSFAKNKSKKSLTRNELETLSKENLIDRILQLEAHNFQLKNLLTKHMQNESQRHSTCDKNAKQFDFSMSYKRHILLKFYYLGWDYQGFAVQEDTIHTIEHHIFFALQKCCLISSREESNYHRCGRTDKGVSAYSQVISLDIRSKLRPEKQSDLGDELPYCKLINRLLPKNIRCICWCPAESDISARFNCQMRTYKYVFPRGNLNIDNMNIAARYIIGTHDFRNLCKMDVANGVVAFTRTIVNADVSMCCKDSKELEASGYDMYQLTISSRAFLWHQIRCIMGILLLIGQGQEKPEVVLQLLDVDKCRRKPQYNLAHEVPLNLFAADFEHNDWSIDQEELILVIRTLQSDWAMNMIKSTMIREMLTDLQSKLTSEVKLDFQNDCLLQGVKAKVYQPLMERTTCEPLENRIQHYVKKRRLEVKQDDAIESCVENS